MDAGVYKEVVDGASPESPIFHTDTTLVGPVEFGFAVRVASPPLCIWAEFASACVCNV